RPARPRVRPHVRRNPPPETPLVARRPAAGAVHRAERRRCRHGCGAKACRPCASYRCIVPCRLPTAWRSRHIRVMRPAETQPAPPGARNGLHTIRTLLPYLWPAGAVGVRLRVLLAAALLIGAKVATVYIP